MNHRTAVVGIVVFGWPLAVLADGEAVNAVFKVASSTLSLPGSVKP